MSHSQLLPAFPFRIATRLVAAVILNFVLIGGAWGLQSSSFCQQSVRLSGAKAQELLNIDDELFSSLLQLDAYYTKLVSEQCWENFAKSEGINLEDFIFISNSHWVAFYQPFRIEPNLCKIRSLAVYQLDENWQNPKRSEETFLAFALGVEPSNYKNCENVPLDDYVYLDSILADETTLRLLEYSPVIIHQLSGSLESGTGGAKLFSPASRVREDFAVAAIGVRMDTKGTSNYYYSIQQNSSAEMYRVTVKFNEDDKIEIVSVFNPLVD